MLAAAAAGAAASNTNPSYRHARHISSLMKEPLIEQTVGDPEPLHAPARPRHASISTSDVKYKHARHVSSPMKPLPLDALITTADHPNPGHTTSAPRGNAAPLSSIAYNIWPVQSTMYKNISGRLSRPFGHSNYHDLEAKSIAASQEKIVCVQTTPAASFDDVSSVGQNDQGTEWIPPMLRPKFSLALSTCFAVLFGLLQLFDSLDRTRDGFAVRSDVRSLLNYIPTMVVILVGFVWDMVLKNLKHIGPWSLMATRWTRAEEGLYLVNYMDALDIKGFLLSIKLRQFGISLGYVGAVLCGALVPFANNLFFTDPISRTTTISSNMVRTSQLLVNDTLTGNGDSTQNLASFDPQSFLNYMAIQRENFELPAWTIQRRALESFNLTALGSSPSALLTSREVNITLAATTSAFNINVTCDPISWAFYDDAVDPDSFITQTRLVPDIDDLEKAKCMIHPEDYPQMSLDPRNLTAWFNYTTCGEYQCPSSSTQNSTTNLMNCGQEESNDLRLTMSVWNSDNFDGDLFALSNNSAVIQGLVCKIETFIDQYEVRVDARESRLLNVGSVPISSQKLSIRNQESIVLKINQYLKQNGEILTSFQNQNDYRFPLDVYLDDPLPEPVYYNPSEYFDDLEIGYFPGAVRPSSNLTRAIGIDRFILMMSQGNNLRIANYANDITQMQKDLSDLLQELVSQIVTAEYRYPDDVEIAGRVIVSATVIHMRQVPLRVLQVILILMSIITVLTSTTLRLKSHLQTDPRSLGAMAMLLSRSDSIENLLKDTGSLSERSFLSQMRGQYIRTSLEDDRTILELQDSQRYSKILHSLNKRRDMKPTPWHHTTLLPTYLIVLLGAVAFMILILGISWWRNDKSSGIAPTSGEGNHAIIYFIPILLVLLIYAVHTFDESVQSLQPYIQLSKEPLKPSLGLDFNLMRYSPFTIDYRSLKQSVNSLSVLSSVVHLLVPGVKIAMAGLFISALRPSFVSTSVPIESSLVSNLDTYNLTNLLNSDSQEELLRSRAMALIQSSPSILVKTAPIGLLDGLIFSNVTNRISNEDIDSILDAGADMHIRIPAIQVTPVCRTFGTADYRSITPSEDSEGGTTINIICDTGPGLGRCPSQAVDKTFNSSSSSNSTADISYFWNRDSLVATPGSDSAPDSPEFDGNGVLQNVTTFLLAKANQPDPSSPGFEITDVASFWCNIKYTAIEINVTVSRPRRAALGIQQTLPLAVKSYDANSIDTISELEAYNISNLNWTNINGLSTLRSIHPLEGKNILYSIMKAWNPKVTDDRFVKSPRLLAQAGGKVLRHYATIMIDLSRPFVEPMSATQSQAAIVDAEVLTARLRLVQSKRTTIIVEVFLGVLFLCVVIIAFGANRKVALYKAPNSIGSQIGLMAGSELVRMVREMDNRRKDFGDQIAGQSGEDALWRAWDGFLVNLGWWERSQARSPNLARSELEVDAWIRGAHVDRGEKRFGIDVGEAERSP